MTPEHTLRLECLKLAMAHAAGLPEHLHPEPDQIVGAAATFADFVIGDSGPFAKAVHEEARLRRRVDAMVAKKLAENYDP